MVKNIKKDLEEFGYFTKNNNSLRLKSLLEACKVLSYRTIILKLSKLRKNYLEKNDKKIYNIYNYDILMLQKWRIKNPELYKIKGGFTLFSIPVGNLELKDIVNNIKIWYTKKHSFEAMKRKYKEIHDFGRYYNLENLDVSNIDNNIKTRLANIVTRDSNGNPIRSNDGLFEEFDFYKAKMYGYNVNIKKWKLSKLTDMSRMFYNSKTIPDISGWGKHLGNLTSTESMFDHASFENEEINLSSWSDKLINVTNMNCMFRGCILFKGKGLNQWGKNLKNVKSIDSMFYICLDFNEKLDNWWENLENLQSMTDLFNESDKDDHGLEIQDFSKLKLDMMPYNNLMDAIKTVFRFCKIERRPEYPIDRIENEKNKNNNYKELFINQTKRYWGIK